MSPPLVRFARWLSPSRRRNVLFSKVEGKKAMGISTTSPTLLERLREADDETAWTRFFDLYSPLIIGFSRQRGCSLDQAHDVLQETMVCLMKALPSFQYDPAKGQFRSFLLRVVDARIKDAYRRSRRLCLMDDAPVDGGREKTRPAADFAEQDAPELWGRMWEYNLLINALEKVRAKVNTRTFRSFELSFLEEQSVSRVAAELGLTRNAVYQHRNRIIRMLRRELRDLKTQIGEA